MAQKKKGASLKAGTAKAKNKGNVAVNFKGIEAGRRRRVRIPEGNYKARVKAAEQKPTKSGDPMVEWIFEIVEHEKQNGQQFYYNNVLVPQSLWSFRAVLEALAVKVKDSTMNIPLGRLVGRTCGIEIVDGEYDGKTRSEINDIFPEALLEEEEEEDEEDDDFEDDEDEADDWDDEEEDEENEDDEDDEDWDDEDEGDEEEVDYLSLGIKELRTYAREQGVYKKGMKKAEIIEALEDEDDEEEIDLDEDEL